METNLSHNLHYKKTSTKTVTHKQLQGHMVDGILLCTGKSKFGIALTLALY